MEAERLTRIEGTALPMRGEDIDTDRIMPARFLRAVTFEGDLHVDDPDGIVEDARFVPVDECEATLMATWQLITEPVGAWLTERWTEVREYRYRVHGATRAEMTVMRL